MPVAKSRLEILQICKLLQCVRTRDKVQIEKLVESGVPVLINLNEPNEGDTPLIAAAKSNDDEIIQLLIELGAHPDVGDLDGKTPPMYAAEYGHVQALTALAELKANLKITDKSGQNVLFYCLASTERHSMCMQIALKYNADVNGAARDGRTAFFSACETAKDNVASCLALLEKGAQPNAVQLGTLRTPLMMACASGSPEVTREALRKGADPNSLDKTGMCAAHYAARNGHFECLVLLSAFGAKFDMYDNKLNNPIHVASLAGHALCIKFLGQRGCNPKPKNVEGELPRTIAKDQGHKDCLKELRKVEKSFGKIGKNNEPWAISLYDWSVERGSDLVRRLKEFDPDTSGFVKKEAFVDVVKSLGAPWTGDCDKKLLSLFDKNKDGTFDYKDFLVAKKYINKLYLMTAYEPKGKKKGKKGKGGRKKKANLPFEVCVMPDEEMYRPDDGGPPIMFIPKSVNVSDNERFNRDNPPKHLLQDDSAWYVRQPDRQFISMNECAKHGDLDSIKLALKKGYSIETRDKLYKTPLMVAAHFGNLEVATFLVESGAEVNAKDNFHWTPLHHACHAGMIDIVELLANNGAIIDAVALNGATPLYRAIESSNVNVVSFLVQKGAKMSFETRKGNNIYEISQDWADPRVVDLIRTKFDLLAPSKDTKGKKGGKKAAGGGKGGKKGGSAKSKGSATPAPPKATVSQALPPRAESPSDENVHARRKASILRAASALAGGVEEVEDISVCPRNYWMSQPNTTHLLSVRQDKRERFGWQSDFPDYKSAFQQNVWRGVLAEGGPDED